MSTTTSTPPSTGVAVTGIGVTAPTGLGTDDYWAATLAGTSALRRLTRFDPGRYPATLAGEVPAFDPTDHLPSRLLPQTDHMTRMALMAAEWAVDDAGVDPEELAGLQSAVITASSSGGYAFGQGELQKLWQHGSTHVSAYQSFAWFYAVNTGQISIRHGLRGPCGVVVSDQAGGLDALGQARRRLRSGGRTVLAGGVDSALCPWGWAGLLTSGRLSTSDDPDRAYLPFDARASGHVAGEGGALLVLERTDDARARGTRVYGEIAGYAATMDPPPDSDREPGLRRTIELALADAGARPDEVDMVFADAAGLPELDRVEARALAAVFGPCGVPVTATKTMTGRLYSGAGSLDVAAALLSIRDGVIPPTVNVEADPAYELDLVVGTARPAEVRTGVVLARGQGGFNSAVVVRAVPGAGTDDGGGPS
jgi:minimal PKS chain-length factor (CLF/KS beta)